jgi:hypothetical protein
MAPKRDGTAREAGAISLSQASTNFGHSTARLRRIKKLQFGIINPEELRQYSVTQAITVNGRKIPAGVTRYEVRARVRRVFLLVFFGENTSGLFLVLCGLIVMHCSGVPSNVCSNNLLFSLSSLPQHSGIRSRPACLRGSQRSPPRRPP